MGRLLPGLNRNTITDRTTRLTWMDRLTMTPILHLLARLTRLPTSGRLTGQTLLGRPTILTRSISMERLNGGDRQEGVYRLTVMAMRNRLNRLNRTVFLTIRQRFIRG